MSTYEQLRDEALGQVSCVGQSDAQSVAQEALYQAMKYLSLNVRVPSLIASATATAPADAHLEANAITLGASGFNISAAFQCVDRLYVKYDSSIAEIGTPYEYREYHHFQDLKSIPLNSGPGIIRDTYGDELPRHAYTITPDSKLWALPLNEDNVLTLVYRKVPAAYVAGNSPEIGVLGEHMLVNAAVVALKEWLREPEQLSSLWTLMKGALEEDIKQYDTTINSSRKRSQIRLHRSYWT